MKRYHKKMKILPRIPAAVGLIIFTAVIFLVAVRQSNRYEAELKLLPLFLELENHTSTSGEVRFGSMILTVPEDWKVESRVNEEGMTECVLTDAHSESTDPDIREHNVFYEHEIVITPYEVINLPESQLILVSQFMDYFDFQSVISLMEEDMEPSSCMWLLCAEDDRTHMNDYFLLSESESGRKELFKVCESSFFSYFNDIEKFLYDFPEFELVKLNDGLSVLPKIWYGYQTRDFYKLFNYGLDNELLVKYHEKRTEEGFEGIRGTVYDPFSLKEISGFYDEKWTDADYIGLMDINGDGYEDFLKYYWAEYSVNDEHFEGYIWNSENREFIFCPGEELLAQYGDAFKEENMVIREENKIPAGLTDHVSEHLFSKRETLQKTLELPVIDRELSEDEIMKLAKENIDIKAAMLEIGVYGGYGIWVKTDGDNDGIEDIYLRQYLGGTLHNVTYLFFKGAEDGSYFLSDSEESIQEAFAFINWEGKVYLVRETYDFDKKTYNGIILQSFQDGKIADNIQLAIEVNDKAKADHVEISYVENEKYRYLAKDLCDFERIFVWESIFDISFEEEKQPAGSEEVYDKKAEEYKWQGDLDNDGELESYKKYIWYPSNSYSRTFLIFESDKEELNGQIEEFINEENGQAMLLWADETEFGNVVYIMYEDGLYDFYVCGYLISEESSQKLLRADFNFDPFVTVKERK